MTPEGDGATRVHFAHSGFGEGPEWDKVHDFFKSGDESELQSLVAHFAK